MLARYGLIGQIHSGVHRTADTATGCGDLDLIASALTGHDCDA
jgi:hypothetical protein